MNPTRAAADEAGPSHQRSFIPNASLESSRLGVNELSHHIAINVYSHFSVVTRPVQKIR